MEFACSLLAVVRQGWGGGDCGVFVCLRVGLGIAGAYWAMIVETGKQSSMNTDYTERKKPQITRKARLQRFA
jgi:hypothetical protein